MVVSKEGGYYSTLTFLIAYWAILAAIACSFDPLLLLSLRHLVSQAQF